MPKKIIGYTIKSTSDEGVYYLVNHWEKHRAFWVKREELKPSLLFSSAGYAQRSLKRLLKIMEDYKNDTFESVVVYELDTGLEKITVVADIGQIITKDYLFTFNWTEGNKSFNDYVVDWCQENHRRFRYNGYFDLVVDVFGTNNYSMLRCEKIGGDTYGVFIK